jgi:hypothetical protein
MTDPEKTQICMMAALGIAWHYGHRDICVAWCLGREIHRDFLLILLHQNLSGLRGEIPPFYGALRCR